MTRRRALAVGALAVAMLAGCRGGAMAEDIPRRPAEPWPLWQAYVARFVSPDGRVIDRAAGDITTSEGQAYALFFALVHDDRPLFHRILAWTRSNLARGDLGDNLPAWKWGRDPAGRWRVLDENSAADADLWLGYTLVEAGRLWRDTALGVLGHKVLALVVKREVATLPGLGAIVLPGPVGFQLDADTWRLNASYLPLQLLRGLATESVAGPWDEIRKSTLRLLRERGAHGFIDDWTAYHRKRGFQTDPVSGSVGSYDAIRVYLWAATLSDQDEARAPLLALLDGPYRHWQKHGVVPEKVDPRQRDQPRATAGPVGFLAVLLPRVQSSATELAALQTAIEKTRDGDLYGKPPVYYDQNLLLFAQGFTTGRYTFAPDGRLHVPWHPQKR